MFAYAIAMAQAHRHYDPLYDGRRAASRLRVNLPARLVLLDRNVPCVIENVSQTGARLVVEMPPKIGEFGQLSCETFVEFFDVVWRDGNRIGVTFDEPLESAKLVALRNYNDAFSELQRREIKALARRWVTGELD